MRQMEGTMSKRQETKEKKQLEKFKKMLAKPDYKGYFFVMIGLVILFQLFDGMATGIFGTLQEAVSRISPGCPLTRISRWEEPDMKSTRTPYPPLL